MTNRVITEEIASLPAEARREVMDFVVFLRQRHSNAAVSQTAIRTPLSREPFVGMWAGRDDMGDSARWVRDIRQREWRRRC